MCIRDSYQSINLEGMDRMDERNRYEEIIKENLDSVSYTHLDVYKRQVLSRNSMTVKRSLNELETAGLIMRVRQGVGEPNRIYVLIPGKEDARCV